MDNMTNTQFKRKLPVPQEIKKEMPLSAEAEAIKTKRDEDIAKVFTGENNKFLLIIGPCSADRAEFTQESPEQQVQATKVCSISLTLIKIPICLRVSRLSVLCTKPQLRKPA